MQATLHWLWLLGGLLLIALVPAFVVTAMFTPPPDDDKPAPSMTDEI